MPPVRVTTAMKCVLNTATPSQVLVENSIRRIQEHIDDVYKDYFSYIHEITYYGFYLRITYAVYMAACALTMRPIDIEYISERVDFFSAKDYQGIIAMASFLIDKAKSNPKSFELQDEKLWVVPP
ncbi:hypothetical protein KEM56_004473 [Ascosphaera pollenicola]|nr:hypothetical protein KEM56_004473 [Ascosphaera pollenicola]